MSADQSSPKKPTSDPAPTVSGNSPNPEYKVGPGHPPREHQFKKGAPSPHPTGRPRKDATLAPDLKKALEDALNKKVEVKRGERQVLISKAVVGIEQLVNQFAKGDRHARCGFRGLRPGIPIERDHAFRSKAATCSDEGGRGVVAGIWSGVRFSWLRQVWRAAR